MLKEFGAKKIPALKYIVNYTRRKDSADLFETGSEMEFARKKMESPLFGKL